MTSCLFDRTFARSLDTIVHEYGDLLNKGDEIEAWVFDDFPARELAEKSLADQGIKARIYSAYKPLVHFFMEELQDWDLHSVRIVYPAPCEAPRRFLLEAYPLAGLLGRDVDLNWEPIEVASATTCFRYDVWLKYRDGKERLHVVKAPNRRHQDHINSWQLSPCGWVTWRSETKKGHDGPLHTDYERVFEAVLDTVRETEWPNSEPLFEELNVYVKWPSEDLTLPYGEEHVSLVEGLHEDIYFSLLEYFQYRANLPLGDRSIQPGQIVPEILAECGCQPQVTVCLKPLSREAFEEDGETELDSADRPLSEEQVHAVLETLGETSLHAHARSGRRIKARYRSGCQRGVLISAAQHANETSGIVGALRAAVELERKPGAHFVISPLENPDGYHLRQRLANQQPRHMHHAARYTAFGNDLQAQPLGGKFEHAIRERSLERSRAFLHINLHGYPSHEWTRPLTGYVPRAFEMWTIPKGFFLIMRCHPGWESAGQALLERVTCDLSRVPGLSEFNRRQVGIFQCHAGDIGFDIMHDIPYLITSDPHQLTPLMLITEYPDETVHGDAFLRAHEAQKATVLSAYEHFQVLDIPLG